MKDIELPIPVTGQEGEGAGVTPATDTSGTPQGGVSTPAQPDEDAAKKISDLESKLKSYQADINRLKSSSDKRLSQQQADFEKRLKDYEAKMQKVQLSSMDEDTRKQFEANLQVERQQELEEQVKKYQMQLEERTQRDTVLNFFLEAGVTKDKLTLDGSLNDLTVSGWDAIREEVETLREENSKLKTSTAGKKPDSTPDTEPEPPITINHSNGAPSKGLTLEEAAKKYADGDMEKLMKLFENGQLPRVLKDLTER